MCFGVFPFLSDVYVVTLALIASIPGPSIVTLLHVYERWDIMGYVLHGHVTLMT